MKFTVIIPAYNSAEFINIPLDCLNRQTFKDFEVYIIDDGSTDNTKEVVEKYTKENENWHYIKKENGNWGSVINYANKNIEYKGEYVTILDSDDFFLDNAFEIVAKSAFYDIVITDIYKQVEQKRKRMKVFFGVSRIIPSSGRRTPISIPLGKFFKTELFKTTVTLREGVSYQDTVLYHDIATRATTSYYINKPLAVWWIDRFGNSTTQKWDNNRAMIWMDTIEDILALGADEVEINAWIAMYLWEMDRNLSKDVEVKRTVNCKVRDAQFMWITPIGRIFAKWYFIRKTEKYIDNS